MADLLLVDFGASRVKSALWSHRAARLVAVRECPAPQVTQGADGSVTAPADSYWQALESTAGALLRASPNADIGGLWLCTEMHGCVLAPAGSDAAGQTYISWRDARATRHDGGRPSTLERLQAQAAAFQAASGMKLRPGLPWLTLAHLQRNGGLPPAFRLLTLADWLLWRGGEAQPAIHPSLAAGTGLYDPHTEDWSAELAALAGLDLNAMQLPDVRPAGAILGHLTVGGRRMPVYGALGDLQAAVQGAGFPRQADLIVNLGTGSQVLCATAAPGAESRPGGNGGRFGAITHIPSGRMLNVFAAFFDSCAQAADGQPFFWQRFGARAADTVLAAPADIDVNVFEAAWRYHGGGVIHAIHEGRFSVDTVLASLAHSWLRQYADAIALLDPDRQASQFLLAGGLSRRAAFIAPVLETLSGRSAILSTSVTGEETLDGLLSLALEHTDGA